MENGGGGVRGQTTTTTTITETHVQTNIRFDPSYIKTIPGAVKVAAIILNLIVFICGVSASNYWRSTTLMEWAYFVSMTAFWVTLILIVMYLFHFTEKFHVIPWSVIEMCFCGLWSFFYVTTAVDNAVNAAGHTQTSALSALAFFAFVAAGVYGFDAFLKFKLWRAGQFVQGERTVQQSQSQAKNVI